MQTTVTAITKNFTTDEAAELSLGQKRLWHISNISHDNNIATYNMAIAMTIRGALDVALFESVQKTLFERHAILRTTYFYDADNKLKQKAQSPADLASWHMELVTNFKNNPDAAKTYIKQLGTQTFIDNNSFLFKSYLIEIAADHYEWVFVIHHSIFDGYSQSVFLNELAQLYNNPNASLPPIPIDYFDYIKWQNEQLAPQVYSKQLEYWKEYLDEFSRTELVTDYIRPFEKSYAGARVPIALSADLTAAVNAITRLNNVTVYTVVAAVFQCLLYYHTSQQDICFGTAINNRNRPEIKDQLKNVIGFFVNTLALRFKVNPDSTFTDVLQNTKTVIEACIYQNSDVPFDQVVTALNIPFDANRNPLFDTMLVWQSKDYQHLPLKDLNVTANEDGVGQAVFDLVLELRETDNTISGFFEYNTDIFATASITQLGFHFKKLIGMLTQQSYTKLKELDLLTPSDLTAWTNLNTNEASLGDNLLNRIEHHALIPGSIATVYCANITSSTSQFYNVNSPIRLSTTYLALKKRTNVLADHIQKNIASTASTSFSPVCVGICLGQSPASIVGLLAILKAGYCFVPLDIRPEASEKRANIIKATRLSLILATNTTKQSLLPLPAAINLITLDLLGSIIKTNDHSPPQEKEINNLQIDQPSYIEFTSGTTGTPKGVVINHTGLINWADELRDRYAINKKDIPDHVLLSAPFTFDASIWTALCLTLAHGATLYITSDAENIDKNAIFKLFHTEKITIATFTPSMLKLFMPEDLPSLRLLFVIGEELHIKDIQSWIRPGITVVNGYGPTEVTAGSNLIELQLDKDNNKINRIPIGKPIRNTGVWVLNPQNNLVPVGVPGEIFISGVGLGRYLDENLTAERFLSMKLPSGKVIKAYKTGDKGRLTREGNIEFLGRIDTNQVKINGVRIELESIKNIIGTQQTITDIQVQLITEGKEKQLAIFAVLARSHLDADNTKLYISLFDKLLAALPVIPFKLYLTKHLPIKQNGKLDTHGLALLRKQLDQEQRNAVDSEEAVNPTLEYLWKSVLQLSPLIKLTTNSNFYHLGGSSLMLSELLASLEHNSSFSKLSPEQKRNLRATPTIANFQKLLQLTTTAQPIAHIKKR